MAIVDFVVKNGLVVTEEAQILGTTDATASNDTAASLYSAGGAAIAKKAYVGTDLSVGNNGSFSGTLTVGGGSGTIGTDQTTFNLLNTTATTINFGGAATSMEIGAATGTTNINNNLDVDGDVNIDGGDLTVSTATFNLANATATTVNFAGAGTAVNIGAATGTTNIKNNLDVDGDVNIDGGDLTVSTAAFNLVNTTATTVNIAGAGTAVSIGAATGTTTINNANTVVTGDLAVNGADITTTATGTATVFNTNATTVNIAGAGTAVNIGAATGTTTVKNNLDVDGDVNIDGGDLTVSTTTFNLANTTATTGNLFGAATAVNIGTSAAAASTLTFGPTITGNTFEINSTAGGTVNLSSDVTTGIVNLYTGLTTGTMNIGSASAGKIVIALTTDTTSNSTGALQVAGGVMVAKDLFVGGGDIITDQATFNLLNANATTVNFAGAGTAITMGASTGSVTVNNPTITQSNATSVTFNMNGPTPTIVSNNTGAASVFNTNSLTGNLFGAATAVNIGTTTGTTTVRSPTLVGSQATQNLYNTIATTMNFAGAATAVNIGATTGTATINNPTVVGSQATVNLWNTTSTTVNFAGAGTAVNIGATSGTATINNPTVVGSQATVNLWNATSTTVNFAGAATALNMGATTGTATINNPTVVGSQTTVNLWNTTSTTVNFAGAGTAVNIGAATGTTNIKNNLDVDLDVNIDGGDLTVSTATFNLANATATTINFAGAATALNMGATSGTATINNPTVVGSQATVNLWNTTSTTVNAFGAATTLALGNTATTAQTVNMFTASTGASTYNFATGATAASTIKTLNIGTGGAASSTTNINIGGSNGGTTTLSSPILTVSGQATFPSAIANRPILGGGFISRETGDDNHDIWGISEDYYPSHGTAGNAWGIRWAATPNEIQFVGGGTNQFIFDLDQGDLTVNGDITVTGGDIVSAAGTNSTLYNTTTTGNVTIYSAQTTGAFTLGGTGSTGAITIGQSTAAQTLNLGTGATANAVTKTINIGTSGVAGSTTNINIGSTAGAGTITCNEVIRSGLVGGADGLDFASNDVYASVRVIRNNTSTAGNNDGMYIGYGNTNSGATRLFGGGSTTTSAQINTHSTAATSSTTGSLVVTGGISSNSQSYFPRILIGRDNNATHGISWYADSYTTWQTYMAQASQTGIGTKGNITVPSGTLVTSWALRSYVEDAAGYGWTWEGGTGSSDTSPTVVAEIRSSDGAARFGAVTNAGFLGSNSSNARNHFTAYNSGAAAAATGWIAGAFGDNNGQRVVIGSASGYAHLGAHNANLSDWAPLFIQNDSSSATVMIGFPWNTASDANYRLKVNGAFAATTKSFLIDHPTKSGMKLRYGSLEGPENGVYVRGSLKNSNIIELPDYWTGLVDPDSITVSITPKGRKQDIYVGEIKDNCVEVIGENIDCFYVVYGERKDVDKLQVEIAGE